MPAAGLRLLPLLAALVVVLSAESAAQARHARHHSHHLRDVYSGDREPQRPDSRPVLAGAAPALAETGGFAAAVAQTIRACGQQLAALQKMSFDLVVNTVQPNNDQRTALEQIRDTAKNAVNELNASCPKQVPARLVDRLDTMRASLDAMKAALLPLRPAFATAYAELDDEQKARLAVLSTSQQSWSQHELESGAVASPDAESQAEQVSFDCEQWPAMLKNWPLNRFESELSLNDEEHAAFYTFMASVYHATARLAASCSDESALTPVRRLDTELAQIDALRQCTDTIAPSLAGFVNALNDQQNAQVNAMLGMSPQSQLRPIAP